MSNQQQKMATLLYESMKRRNGLNESIKVKDKNFRTGPKVSMIVTDFRALYIISLPVLVMLMLYNFTQVYEVDKFAFSGHSYSHKYPESLYFIVLLSFLLSICCFVQCIKVVEKNSKDPIAYLCIPYFYKRLDTICLTKHMIKITCVWVSIVSIISLITGIALCFKRDLEIWGLFFITLSFSFNMIIWSGVFITISLRRWVNDSNTTADESQSNSDETGPNRISLDNHHSTEMATDKEGTSKQNQPSPQEKISETQKEASICLVAFFAGFDRGSNSSLSQIIINQAMLFFAVGNDPENLARILMKYNNVDSIFEIISSIRDKKAKEFLLLSCYDLAKSTKLNAPMEMVYSVANDLGYDREKFTSLISQYSNV